MSEGRLYEVLSGQTPGQLSSEVDLYLRRGWQTTGGVVSGRDGTFHQAVVRRPQPPNGTINLREPIRKTVR